MKYLIIHENESRPNETLSHSCHCCWTAQIFATKKLLNYSIQSGKQRRLETQKFCFGYVEEIKEESLFVSFLKWGANWQFMPLSFNIIGIIIIIISIISTHDSTIHYAMGQNTFVIFMLTLSLRINNWKRDWQTFSSASSLRKTLPFSIVSSHVPDFELFSWFLFFFVFCVYSSLNVIICQRFLFPLFALW